MRELEFVKALRNGKAQEAKEILASIVVEKVAARRSSLISEAGEGKGGKIKSKLSSLSVKTLKFKDIKDLEEKKTELEKAGKDVESYPDKLELKVAE